MRLTSVLAMLALLAVIGSHAAAQMAPPEPPAAAASPAVRQILEEAVRLVDGKKPDEALAALDRALGRALAAMDIPGEAVAQRARAVLLQDTGHAVEAAAAWQAAQSAWNRSGDGPGQVEALCRRGLLTADAAGSRRLVEGAIALARGETRRPRAAAAALHDAGRDAIGMRRLDQAERLVQAGLSIRDRVAPGSRELGDSLHVMGYLLHSRDDLPGARVLYQKAVAVLRKVAPDSRPLAMSLNSLGLVAFYQGDLPAAKADLEASLAITERLAPDSLSIADTCNNLGILAGSQGDLGTALGYFQRALTLYEKLAPTSPVVATVLGNLGRVAEGRKEYAAARRYYERALALTSQADPESPGVANALMGLASVQLLQGDRSAATASYERALAIQDRLAPQSMDAAMCLESLGNLYSKAGDQTRARRNFLRALAILERQAPDSEKLADCLDSLGTIAKDTGDLAAARRFHEQQLAILQRRTGPGTPPTQAMAGCLNALGNVVADQGDLVGAKAYYARALRIARALEPDSLNLATYLNNLGTLAFELGQTAEAEVLLEQSLAIREKLALPGVPSIDVAMSLNNLGAVAIEKKNPLKAREYYQRALAIREKLDAGSLDVANSFSNLGSIASELGDHALGKRYFQQALLIQEARCPGSLPVATTHHNLGVVLGKLGDRPSALQHARTAWSIVRRQWRMASGDEARQAFSERYGLYPARLVGLLIESGDIQAAFQTLEEGRAQALLAAISNRDADLKRLTTPQQRSLNDAAEDLAEARKALETAWMMESRAERQLEAQAASGAAAGVLAPLRTALAACVQAREQATELEVEKRQTLERISDALQGSLTDVSPPARPLDSLRRSLPPDALLVTFSVSEEETVLMLVGRQGPIRSFALPIGEGGLQARVTAVLDACSATERSRGTKLVRPQQGPGVCRSLFQTLFPPEARALIGSAGRLVICPEGPLWSLPFAALVTNQRGAPAYLGLQKPLCYTPSLGLYARFRSTARPAEEGPVMVVGDPLYEESRRQEVRERNTRGLPVRRPARAPGSSRRAAGELAVLSRDGSAPDQLPNAFLEARSVEALYRSVHRPVVAGYGELPTEAWFRRTCRSASIIHLATHGYYNPFMAMSSGIRLAIAARPAPGETGNDGALQAWELSGGEIKLNAGLVVLSACQTGVGEARQGEGLVGLTRSFQLAGARSVVASQWSVSDESTAALMVAFHKGLKAGLPKDEALRIAMLAIARDTKRASPYHWAPFLLTGDPAPLRK